MSQKIELERVKARIRALTEKTVENGCTEDEAASAMLKVGELLAAYGLSMSEVSVREDAARCRTVTVLNDGPTENGLTWCSLKIGDFLGCRVWTTRTREGKAIAYFGTEIDTDLAVYLSTVIRNAAATELAAYRKTQAYRRDIAAGYNGRAMGSAFLSAFAARIRGRLDEMIAAAREADRAARREQEERERAAANPDAAAGPLFAAVKPRTGGALVVLKGQLVEAEFAKLGMKLRTTRSSAGSRGSAGAWSAGSAAGGRVNLNRPIGGSSTLRIGA